MCYAIPGKVVVAGEKYVEVDYFGERKQALRDGRDLSVGDYIYAQGGYVITKVSASEALATLDVWKDLFFELQSIDQKTQKFSPGVKTRYVEVQSAVNCALASQKIEASLAQYLLRVSAPAETEFLFESANYVRHHYHQNACCVHGIIEISNYCKRNCYYCGISSHNENLPRYRMTKEEILASVKSAVVDYGFKALVLQSGESAGYSVDELVDIVSCIKANYDCLLFISFGEIGREALQKLYEVGARGLLMRFETSNPKLYEELHPGFSLAARVAEIRAANEIGYLIITGSLIGLPGQTKDDILADLRLAADLNVEMLSMGPFLAHPQTPLAQIPSVSEQDIIRTLAVARLILPSDVKILVTTGLETLNSSARKLALQAGANSVMLNVTPVQYRHLYDLYPNRAYRSDTIQAQITQTIDLLKQLGRAPTDLSVRS